MHPRALLKVVSENVSLTAGDISVAPTRFGHVLSDILLIENGNPAMAARESLGEENCRILDCHGNWHLMIPFLSVMVAV